MLDLSHCDALSQDELREHKTVKIREDGAVAVQHKGQWITDPHSGYGLHSATQSALSKINKPGTYAIPTADEWQRESAIRATPNPWKKSSWNLTKQITLTDEDPALAERFQREARQ